MLLPFLAGLTLNPSVIGLLFESSGRADLEQQAYDQAAHVAHFTAPDQKATNRQSTGSHRLAIKGTKARSQARFQDHPRGYSTTNKKRPRRPNSCIPLG